MNVRGKMYIPVFLAVGGLISAAQTTTPNSSTVPSSQTPAASSPAAPPKDPTPPASQTTAPPPTQTAPAPGSNQATTPATSNPAGTASGASQSAAPETASFGNLNAGGLTSDQLQQRIDSALHNEPTLSGSNLVVNVAEDAIDLSGNVGTAKERLTARRIVQSFAGNRRVREHVTVSGGGARRNEPNVNTPQPTQESGKSEQQNLNRPITNPATDGDKSEDPR